MLLALPDKIKVEKTEMGRELNGPVLTNDVICKPSTAPRLAATA